MWMAFEALCYRRSLRPSQQLAQLARQWVKSQETAPDNT